MSELRNPSVLLIGNFLSNHVGNFSVCEDLAVRLRESGMKVITASDRKARVPRLTDMLATVLTRRNQYQVASVDVYSGLGFGLAEATCYALRAIGKPYVLTLRGGNLPHYSKRWPRRVQRLLSGAAAVTTPSNYLLQTMQGFRSDLTLLPNPLH
ncbi:MAG: glycosyl transferase family 1, partial [Novipirellula sp. JB048]